MTRVIVTGASGFVGQNLVPALKARTGHDVIAVTRDTALDTIGDTPVDHIIHLAGANLPATESGFLTDNVDYAQRILSYFRPASLGASFHYASSIQVNRDDAYGRSKKAGEDMVCRLAPEAGWTPVIWRLPNLFGKWCRPNYNSFVATFMNQAIKGEPFSIDNPQSQVELLYIDNLIDMFIEALATNAVSQGGYVKDFNTTRTTVGEVAELIEGFRRTLDTTRIPVVGDTLVKQLHATFLSYLDQDARLFGPSRFAAATGSFSELYKSESFGQVSSLTIEPGASRGAHYHHTKIENFHLAVGKVELSEYDIRGGETLVRTIEAGQSFWTRPGWVHTLTNTGEGPAALVVWANEIFDHDRPDTYRPNGTNRQK
ncbi:NAD-dependent epimerase/dehydratase family protein [Sulfitobacter faviae]|uniref:polysaccharide biosynthesis C-terminal domain-containing protein n=1 Tax=Sulfitobacter faviae TaxID=1775881 RepID=UPI00398CA3A8